eukprot:6197686-Pleurochrysis_carterae.AAC.1
MYICKATCTCNTYTHAWRALSKRAHAMTYACTCNACTYSGHISVAPTCDKTRARVKHVHVMRAQAMRSLAMHNVAACIMVAHAKRAHLMRCAYMCCVHNVW